MAIVHFMKNIIDKQYAKEHYYIIYGDLFNTTINLRILKLHYM